MGKFGVLLLFSFLAGCAAPGPLTALPATAYLQPPTPVSTQQSSAAHRGKLTFIEFFALT